jgi:hypothetical protein
MKFAEKESLPTMTQISQIMNTFLHISKHIERFKRG